MKNNLNSLKSTELKLMQIVDSFCKTKGLKYYLAFGTLLGCVRHQGFIPWDDDVDIFMPRDDYEIFVKSFVSEKAYLIDNQINKKYTYPFAKVCDKETILEEIDNTSVKLGIYIDVFPIDGLPADKKEQIKHLRKIYHYKRLLIHKFSSIKRKRNFLKTIFSPLVKILLLPLSYSYLIKRITKLSTKYSFGNSDYVSCNVWGYEYKTFKKNWFCSGHKEKFENFEFNVPDDYDSVLSCLYGEYMVLPPVEERNSNHNFAVKYISENEENVCS